MDIKTVKELIRLISETNLSEVRIEDGDFKITIRTQNYAEGRAMGSVPQAMAMPIAAPLPIAAPAAAPAPAPPAPAPAAPAPVAKEAAPEASPASKLVEVRSPMVGTFYRAPGPGKAAYIQVGDSISKGQPVCIIEAMKLFNEVESDVSGRVVKVLIDDASPVEYDQPLFLVEPA
jgi:acetyl-CoA carboxylase biotin carboxyl carrier protein